MADLILKQVDSLNHQVSSFWFEADESFDYLAGQAAELILPHKNPDNRGNNRWFTLSSSPSEPRLAITTKKGNSSFKLELFSLTPGNRLSVLPAMGDFVLPKDVETHLIFIVGGLGITPVRSIIKWLIDSGQSRKIDLIYSSSYFSDFLFLDLLESYPPLKLDLYLTQKLGKLNADYVLKSVTASSNSLFYISGPDSFTTSLVRGLEHKGVSSSQIVADFFSGY